VALVTGACSGIGRALATRLGSLGYELILVSNRAVELAAAAQEIAAANSVAVHTIVSDLARPEAAEELYQTVRGKGLAVDILVSNAGFSSLARPWMRRRAGQGDVAASRGHAVVAVHLLWPRHARAWPRSHPCRVEHLGLARFPRDQLLRGSKKYLRGFARSLRSEMSVYGVNVTCLAPGPTATNLYDANVVPVQRAQRLGIMMEASTVAESGLRAMFAGRAEHIPGLLARIMTWFSVLVPQWAIDLLRRRAPWLPRRKGTP